MLKELYEAPERMPNRPRAADSAVAFRYRERCRTDPLTETDRPALGTANAVELRIYRIAPEFRRSAIYAMVGFALLVPVAFWSAHVMQRRDPLNTAFVCGSFGAIALAMIVPLRWALQVGECGIARRWLFGWDFWSWGDFASGRIEKRYPITFVDPERPWWRRKLRIAYLADAELKDLIQLINEHYRLPATPVLDEVLRIKYGFRRSVEFDWRDIRLKARGESHYFTWKEVQRLRITRMDSKRRDFTKLELVLPDQEIELKLVTVHGVTTPTWTGASGEALNEFLLAHVPAERIVVDIAGECPGQAVDVQKQLSAARKNERDFRIVTWIVALLVGGLLIWIAIDVGLLRALAMTAITGLYAPIIWFMRRGLREQTKKLEMWLDELQNRQDHLEPIER